MGLTYQELFEKIEAVFEEEIDSKFQDLFNVIRDLKSKNETLIQLNNVLIEHNRQLRSRSVVSNESVDDDDDDDGSGKEAFNGTDEEVVSPPPTNVGTKKHFDVLIISDSIYRHVGIECPKDRSAFTPRPIISTFDIGQITFMKVVCPGARCDFLWAEAVLLNVNYNFDHVILHVGTNYVPNSMNNNPRSPLDTSDEICQLLNAIGPLLQAKVSYSYILPRLDLSVIDGINAINTTIFEYCSANNIAYMPMCLSFKRVKGVLDRSLFANDGVHLSRKGVAAIFNCMCDHVHHELKYSV